MVEKIALELTPEEVRVIENRRAILEKTEQAELKKTKIEEDFKKAYDQSNIKIKEHLENAKCELRKAIAISEERGTPFESDICDGERRVYCPQSFSEKWGELNFSELTHLYYSDLENGTYGWEYWSYSSMRC